MDPQLINLHLSQLFVFVCAGIAFKMVVDAITRFRALTLGVSETLLAELLRDDARRRRASSLRWGIFLVSVGLGFALLALLGWNRPTPGSIAIIAISAGLGQLIYHRLQRAQP